MTQMAIRKIITNITKIMNTTKCLSREQICVAPYYHHYRKWVKITTFNKAVDIEIMY